MVQIGSVLVGGDEFGYLSAGEPDGSVPVVLLHAAGQTAESWMLFLSRWDGLGVAYSLDLRGHGLSVWGAPYGLEVFARDVLGFMDAMGFAEVDLVGHLMGGLVGCLVASIAPERVRRLVVADVGVPHPRERAVVDKPGVPLDFDWDLVPAVRAELDRPDPRWPSYLARIQADTLVLGGGPSSPVPLEHVAELAVTVPHARLVSLGADRAGRDVSPEELTAAVIGHLTAAAG